MKKTGLNYSINIDDKAIDALKATFSTKSYVKVGIIGNNVHLKKDKKGNARKFADISEKNTGLSNADIAIIHEFGVSEDNIPQRSFLRKTLIMKNDEFMNWINDRKKGIFKQIIKDGWNVVLAKFGAKWVSYIHECFDTKGWGSWKALSKYTIARRIKKSDIPLQDTGQLRRAVSSEVIQ